MGRTLLPFTAERGSKGSKRRTESKRDRLRRLVRETAVEGADSFVLERRRAREEREASE